jgi:predicted PhzF superfamily epimerase YddE/YHI9
LLVQREGNQLHMNFPVKQPAVVEAPTRLLQALGLQDADEVLLTDDYLVIVENEEIVSSLSPDFPALASFNVRGIAVSAPGHTTDFVSRWFGPRVGVNEDPVTGSAHTSLMPYWAKRLGKTILHATQGGLRKGQLTCELLANDRMLISGNAVLYLQGTIFVHGFTAATKAGC